MNVLHTLHWLFAALLAFVAIVSVAGEGHFDVGSQTIARPKFLPWRQP